MEGDASSGKIDRSPFFFTLLIKNEFQAMLLPMIEILKSLLLVSSALEPYLHSALLISRSKEEAEGSSSSFKRSSACDVLPGLR